MPRLVAFDLPGGPLFLDLLRAALDAGDAVLPLDQRLSTPARERLVAALAPSAVLDASGEEHRLSGGLPTLEGDALVVATSGTTGTPKGVVLTRAAIEASARATSARLGVDPDRDRWCCCLPLAHVGGLSVLTRAIVTGTPVEVHPGFDAEIVAAAARERGATLVSLVPTTMRRLGAAAEDYRVIVLGGSAPPEHVPRNAVTTYGMTETGSGVVYDGRDPKDGEGWLATGDAGELADGRLVVHGRLDDVVISGGENVWPEAVEAVLARHPLVAEVGITGAADPEWGMRVVAHVVPVDPALPPPLEELRELVRAELGPWAAPRELHVRAALPRTALGKLRRSILANP